MLQGQECCKDKSPANKFLLREGDCVVNNYISCTRRESPCLHSMPKLPGWVLHCPGNVHYDGGGGKRRVDGGQRDRKTLTS